MYMLKKFLTSLALVMAVIGIGGCFEKDFNNAPVIGVLTLPMRVGDIEEDGKYTPFDPETMDEEEHSHYILYYSVSMYLELAGARVVPIFHDASEEELIPLLNKLNGVLFSGGDLDLVDRETEEYHIYTKTSQIIFNYALNRTDEGDEFPLFGICQGFQLLNILRSEERLLLKHGYADTKVNDYLYPHVDNYTESRLFSRIDHGKEKVYAQEKVAINIHDWSVYLSDYTDDRPELAEFYQVLSYAEDDEENVIVTAIGTSLLNFIEAHSYPIYGVQFHPERTFYRFSEKHDYVRTPEARALSEDLIFFFVEETRRSNHTFDSWEELDKLTRQCQRRIYGNVEFTGEYTVPILIDKDCLRQETQVES
ncbi:unnamed protein product [Moneuplotes crassus]|uniref:folate gamma-glutamyl hydrolase n=1 Tax=Euplotes crassus TaxID=5936 RepID=A0AAD1UR42_EUPCR|nr:unnamed protein product [Moneuplotes crassus]